jgi:alpha-D-ribose 1-methylphosphonate 5-triphosphate synthase subunit PhnL
MKARLRPGGPALRGAITASWATVAGTGAAASLALAMLVAVCAFVAVAVPRASLGYRTQVLQRAFHAASSSSTTVLADADITGLSHVMPMRFAGVRRRPRARRADELLDMLGVGYCAGRRPAQMSGGEQQRTAIATALANGPQVLLADEPTGELDSATARDVFGALQTANAELGVTVLVVTHDPAVSSEVRRTIAIRDGRTSTETLRHDGADEHGHATRHAVEYAVTDRAGRVQLPREMTEALGMKARVRLEHEPDHIGVWPDQERPGS